ncbi:MAG: hypothetical protein NTW87_05005 [Planctomycetota bacterium]|nr:hypothetical protein [Planctomycetota bacterium]
MPRKKRKPRRMPSLARFRRSSLAGGAKVTGSTVAQMREEERW